MNAAATIWTFFLLHSIVVQAQQTDSLAVVDDGAAIVESDSAVSSVGFSELEIGELIIDNTFSKAGNDFQQLFNTRWSWPTENAAQFIITISEKPSFVNSTIVEISINDLKVFESFLQPRYDILEEVAAQAIDITLQYILNYEEVLKELSGEDLSGSGIY